MEKLLKLLNEYENRDLELEEGEESITRTENNGHLRFNGANKVQFDTYMFDSLALSRRYGFIKWLLNRGKIGTDFLSPILQLNKRYNLGTHDTILMFLSTKENPVSALISMLK